MLSIKPMNKRQNEILYYLYRFRFLTRNQLQQLLHHKHFNRVIVWLNNLTESDYIRRYYNSKTVTIPAVYSLGLNGRKYLKNNPNYKNIKPTVLDRVWREHKLSAQFRNHCLFLADIYLSLSSLTSKTKAKLCFYTKTDLRGIKDLILPYPDAYFSIEEATGSKKYYFLDIFDDLPARMVLRKRVRQYFGYYTDECWQNHTKKPFPEIILVCPDERSKNYLCRYIPKPLEYEPEIRFYLSTWGDIRSRGISKETLQKVELVPVSP